MTKHLKKVLFLSLLWITTLTLFNCEYDKNDETHVHTNSKISFEKQSVNVLFKNETFNRAFQKIPKKEKIVTSITGKTVMEEQYNFTILNAPVNITTSNDIVVYNILVKSDSLDVNSNFYENLILNVNQTDNTLKAFLVKYLLDNENNIISRELKNIEYNDSSISNFSAKEGTECYSILVLQCCNDPNGSYGGCHDIGSNCYDQASMNSWSYVTDDVFCVSGSGGGSSDGSFGSDNTSDPTYDGEYHSGGSSSGNGNLNSDIIDELYDNPTPPCDTCPEIDLDGDTNDPCTNLNSITNNETINQSIKTLREKTNQGKENGITFATGALGNVQTIASTSTSENTANVKVGPTIFATSHTHQDGIYPMFSPGDLLAPCMYANNYQQPLNNVFFDNLFFNLMVVESNSSTNIADSQYGFVYALFPNDIEEFKNFLSTLNNPIVFEQMNSIIQKLYRAQGNWNEVNQQKLASIFLKFINNVSGNGSGYNFNVSLYRKPLDASYLPTGNWEKLSLNATQPNGIRLTPCN